jgi:hypothetical protein
MRDRVWVALDEAKTDQIERMRKQMVILSSLALEATDHVKRNGDADLARSLERAIDGALLCAANSLGKTSGVERMIRDFDEGLDAK